MVLDGLQDNLSSIGDSVLGFIQEKPLTTTAVGVGIVGATALGVMAKKKSKAKKKRTSKGISRDRKFRSKQKHELAYVRRKRKLGKKITRPTYKKRTSKKRVGKIYYTKKGQPYKIMASGKARFIKKTKGRKK